MVASRGAGGPGLRYGVSSMWSPLRRVLVRRPATAGDFADAGWRQPDPSLLSAQHEAFCELLASLGCEVEVAAVLDGLVDATYIRDPGLVTQRGGGWGSGGAGCSRWPSRSAKTSPATWARRWRRQACPW